jgi:hypothetical protein
MGTAGLERVKEYFTLDRQAKQYQDWYEEIASKKALTNETLLRIKS